METKKFIQSVAGSAALFVAFLAGTELHQRTKISAVAIAEFYDELSRAETSQREEERRHHLRCAHAAYSKLGVINTLECRRKYKEIKKALGL